MPSTIFGVLSITASRPLQSKSGQPVDSVNDLGAARTSLPMWCSACVMCRCRSGSVDTYDSSPKRLSIAWASLASMLPGKRRMIFRHSDFARAAWRLFDSDCPYEMLANA